MLPAMFDHVGITVSDIAASERFYRTVLSTLAVEPTHADAELVEWDDFCIGPTDREHPVTRGLHVAFRAPDRAHVDAGHREDGAPGLRPQYSPTYYGGFLLDPDGNSIEAVHGERTQSVPTVGSTTYGSVSRTSGRRVASTPRSPFTPVSRSATTSGPASGSSGRTSASP